MKVKVSEAKGQVLDYLVAQAMGMKIYRSKSGRWMRANYGEFNHRHGTPWFEPTRNWGYGGLIIELGKDSTRHLGRRVACHTYRRLCYL
jgi:hypothetical protein